MVRARVLVVEDDEHLLKLIQDILAAHGYAMSAAPHPDVVLDYARRDMPDLFLIDIMLPKQSGIEVADRLWLNEFGGTPMIAFSASTVMRDLARHTHLFCEVLPKPFDLTQFLDAVERAIQRQGPCGRVASQRAAAGLDGLVGAS